MTYSLHPGFVEDNDTVNSEGTPEGELELRPTRVRQSEVVAGGLTSVAGCLVRASERRCSFRGTGQRRCPQSCQRLGLFRLRISAGPGRKHPGNPVSDSDALDSSQFVAGWRWTDKDVHRPGRDCRVHPDPTRRLRMGLPSWSRGVLRLPGLGGRNADPMRRVLPASRGTRNPRTLSGVCGRVRRRRARITRPRRVVRNRATTSVSGEPLGPHSPAAP